MKKHAITLGLLLALILVAGMLVRHITDPVAKLTRDLEGEKGALAALALADMGSRAESAVPALIKALHKENEELRLTAAIALGKIGKGAVAPLTRLLGSKDENVRYYALAGLGWIGPEASSAFAAVLKSLKDKNPDVRGKAVYTLSLIAEIPEEAAAALVPSLGDRDGDVQSAAVECLVKVGRPAVPFLIAALKENDETLQSTSIRVLGEIGLEASAAPALGSLLLGKEERLRQPAAAALGQLGPDALGVLREGVRDSRSEVSSLALNTLGGMDGAAAPLLIEALTDPRVEVRRDAAFFLGSMAFGDQEVNQALVRATKDPDEQVCRHASIGLINHKLNAPSKGKR